MPVKEPSDQSVAERAAWRENVSQSRDNWRKLYEEAEADNKRLRLALRRCIAAAGRPDASAGCRAVIRFAEEALRE